ncbi:MAG: hypothetical protein WA979_07180, partial [Pacificimonas sp.]
IQGCVEERVDAISRSSTLLAQVNGFENADTRQSYVLKKFNLIDALFRSIATPEGDPRNWNGEGND